MIKILKTAFNPPNIAHTVQRESLLEKIRQQKGKRLILLKAGPGFGKTLLAASYFAEVEQKIWIAIPKGYFSFFDLLIHLVYALNEKLHCQQSQELLEYCHLLQTEELITQIFRLITDQVKGNLYIFIDDIHHLLYMETEKEKMFEIFFSFLPVNTQVILTSHQELAFPSVRFTQSGDYYQIEEHSFSFTLNETRELLLKHHIVPTLEELHRIDQVTNGWISFIILLVNELQGMDHDWDRVLQRVQVTAGNYLEHFVANLPNELQKFLVEISIFEFLDATICDNYLKRENSKELLDRLLTLNFIYRMENNLFGMHQLLRDNLLSKIDKATLPAKYSVLAEIALEYQNLKAAIFYLIKGEKYLEAVKLMLEFNEDRVRDIILMQQWLELIPEEYYAHNPLLYFYRGQVLERSTYFQEALEDYLRAEELCRGQVDAQTYHIISAHVIGLYWHRREFSKVIEMCYTLLAEVDENEYKTLAIVHNLLGTSLIEQLNRSEGVKHLKKALENCRLSGVKNQEAWILNNLCFWEYIPSGEILKAVAGYEEALQIFLEGEGVRGKILIYLNLGNLYLRMGQIAKAKEMFDETERINIRIKNFNGMISLFILQARAEILDHNLSRAEELLKQIPDSTGLNDFLRTQIYLTYSYFYLEKGDMAKALSWVEQALGVASFRTNYLSLEFFMQKIKIYYLNGEYAKALCVIAEVKEEAQKWGYSFYLCEVLFYESVIMKILGESDGQSLKRFIFLVQQKEMYFLLDKYNFLTCQLYIELHQGFKERERVHTYLDRVKTSQSTLLDAKVEVLKPQENEVLQIHLFGEFMLRSGTLVMTTEGWLNKKALNLLKYLVLNRGQSMPQSQVLQYFWPDLEMKKARQNLYVALNIIRKKLEPELRNSKESQYVISQKGYCKFDAQISYWLDVEEFEKCYVKGRSAVEQTEFSIAEEYYWKARTLYKSGLLLENLYDDWCKEYRLKYQNMYIEMMQNLFALIREKNPVQALELAIDILTIDPYIEVVNLAVLELLMAMKNVKGVLDHYRKIKELYQSELGLEVPESIQSMLEKYVGSVN